MKNFKKTILTMVYCLLIIFGLNDVLLAQEESIDFRNYSISHPGKDWNLKNISKENQMASLEKIKTKKENSQLIISYVPILDPELRKLSEDELADGFIEQEKYLMMTQGDQQGLYKLANVEKSVDIINDKKFYIMSYQNLKGSYIIDGLLYVHIPLNQNEEMFIMVFTNGHRKNQPLPSSKEEFIKVLRSFDVK